MWQIISRARHNYLLEQYTSNVSDAATLLSDISKAISVSENCFIFNDVLSTNFWLGVHWLMVIFCEILMRNTMKTACFDS